MFSFSLPTIRLRSAVFSYSIAVAGCFLMGCASGPRYLANDFHSPACVAVLPFTNLTNDVTAPDTVRKVVLQSLPSRGYHPLDANAVDDILKKKFGITEGGQLGSASPKKIAEAVSADALVYGEVISFMDLPLGYVRKRTVKVNLKMLDAQTEAPLWEDQRSWTTPEIHVNPDEVKAAAVRQVAERQVEKMSGQFLLRETQIVVDRLLDTLPSNR